MQQNWMFLSVKLFNLFLIALNLKTPNLTSVSHLFGSCHSHHSILFFKGFPFYGFHLILLKSIHITIRYVFCVFVYLNKNIDQPNVIVFFYLGLKIIFLSFSMFKPFLMFFDIHIFHIWRQYVGFHISLEDFINTPREVCNAYW